MSIKSKYYVREISKNEAEDLIINYHYLKDSKFLSIYSYGLVNRKTEEIVGCAVYYLPQGTLAIKSWFGDLEDKKGIYELNRLVMSPKITIKNATSYLLGNSLKQLHKIHKAKAVISLADTSRHVGFIYQATNFKYYGVTREKTDFYTYSETNTGKIKKNVRGSTKNTEGVWLPRTRKHRYAICFDKTLKVNFEQLPYPKNNENIKVKSCCENSKVVYDARFNTYYTCPLCTKKLEKIK